MRTPHMHENLPLYDYDGQLCAWRSRKSIDRLHELGRVSLLRHRRLDSLLGAVIRQSDGKPALRSTIYVGTRYSYREHLPSGYIRHELRKLAPTRDSHSYAPAHVRSIFLRVLTDCIVPSPA